MDSESGLYDKMNSGLDKSSKLMDLTTKKIDQILNSSSGRVTCYLVIAIVFFILLLWILWKRIDLI